MRERKELQKEVNKELNDKKKEKKGKKRWLLLLLLLMVSFSTCGMTVNKGLINFLNTKGERNPGLLDNEKTADTNDDSGSDSKDGDSAVDNESEKSFKAQKDDKKHKKSDKPLISLNKNLTYNSDQDILLIEKQPEGTKLWFSIDGGEYTDKLPNLAGDKPLGAGNHTIHVKMEGGEDYEDFEEEYCFEIKKAEAKLELGDFEREVDYPNTVEIRIPVIYYGDGGLNVKSSDESVAEVKLKLTERAPGTESGVMHQGSIIIKILKDGEFDLAIFTRDDRNYTSIQESYSFAVKKSIYRLTIDPAEGAIATESQDVEYKAIVKLAEALRKGYDFVKWSLSNEDCSLIDDVYTQGKGDATLTANWQLLDYQIKYQLNGGINNEENPGKYTVEDEIELLAPSRSGYDFAGWSEDGKVEKGSTGEKTFVANWTPINYSISYDLAGGTNNENNPDRYNCENEVRLQNPTRHGYAFAGWTDNGLIPEGSMGDKVFTARWTPVSYQINYQLNGGQNAGSNPATYTIEDQISLAAPSREDYEFTGWSNGGVINRGSSGAVSFAANWKQVKTAVTVNEYISDAAGGNIRLYQTRSIQHLNLGSSQSISPVNIPGYQSPGATSVTVRNGSVVNFYHTQNVSVGYSFTGSSYDEMYVSANGSGYLEIMGHYGYGDAAIFSDYGKTTWYRTNGGSWDRDGVNYNQAVGVNISSWWNTGEKMAASVYDGAYGRNNNHGDAMWFYPVVTVSYDGNGGSAPGAVDKWLGSGMTLASSSRDGYSFKGWYDTDLGCYYAGGQGVSASHWNYNSINVRHKTLRAVWQKNAWSSTN